MKGRKFSIITVFIGFIVVSSAISVYGLKSQKSDLSKNSNADGYYFVQITDTHVTHKQYDKYEVYKQNFQRVLKEINSFKDKPAFVVLTGDCVEWGGSDKTGENNYQTLVSCLYKNNNQLFVDPDFTIPLYTTPGNHDYIPENSLINYYTYLNSNNRYIKEIGPVSLFFMDSGSNYYLEPWDWTRVLGAGLFDGDINWLEKKLENSDHLPLKIILMHHPAVNERDSFGVMFDVIARNREAFIDLCENYDVDLVLTGHTHSSIVYDGNENIYNDYPLRCSEHSTLYVQSDDCKQHVNYRNITVSQDDIIIHDSVRIDFEPKNIGKIKTKYTRFYDLIVKIKFSRGILKSI